jgi:hypothetical protein
MPTDPRISGGVSGRTEGSTRHLTARTSPIRGTGQAAAEPPPDHRLRSTDPRAPVDPALLESAVKEASEGTISPSDSATSSPRGPLHEAREPPAPAAAGTDEHDASLDAALAALLDQLKERVTNISDSQLAYVTHFFEGLDSRNRDKWATTLLSFAHLIEGADSTAAPLSSYSWADDMARGDRTQVQQQKVTAVKSLFENINENVCRPMFGELEKAGQLTPRFFELLTDVVDSVFQGSAINLRTLLGCSTPAHMHDIWGLVSLSSTGSTPSTVVEDMKEKWRVPSKTATLRSRVLPSPSDTYLDLGWARGLQNSPHPAT